MCGATLSKVQFSRRRRRRWRRRRAGGWADGEESFVLRRKRSSGSLGSAHNGDGVNFVDPAAIATTGFFGGIWLPVPRAVIKRAIIKPSSVRGTVCGTLAANDEITRRFDRLCRYSRLGIKSRWQFFSSCYLNLATLIKVARFLGKETQIIFFPFLFWSRQSLLSLDWIAMYF